MIIQLKKLNYKDLNSIQTKLNISLEFVCQLLKQAKQVLSEYDIYSERVNNNLITFVK